MYTTTSKGIRIRCLYNTRWSSTSRKEDKPRGFLPPRTTSTPSRIITNVGSLISHASATNAAGFQRLAGSVPSVVRLRGESVEKMAFDRRGMREDELGGEGEGELVLERGTLVELRRSTTAINAVVLAASYTSSSRTCSSSGLTYLSLTSTGEVWPHTKDDVYFSVPGVVTRDVVRMCGGEGEDGEVPEIATTQPQLQARVLVLKKLRQIQRDVEDAMNTLLSRQVDVYALTRAVDAEQWGETTLEEVARMFGPVNRNPNPTRVVRHPGFAQIFAAHKYIVANPVWFVLAHDYATSKRIRVRPAGDVQRLRWVEGVIRDQGHEIDQFISLCHSIISTSPPFLLSPPKSTSSTTRQWSPSAQIFIRHLIKSLKPQHPAQIDPYLLGVQYIVKKVYPEVDDVFDEVVHRLLVDIGAIAPWQDLTQLRAMSEGELFLGDSPTPNPRIRQSPPLGPDDFYPTDPAHDIRHDFGDMPVYVIDDTNAQELDDGISVEPHSSSKLWIHIHIADPTSLLPPTHALAKHAEKMTQSMYFVQGACAMLPRSFTHHDRGGFSLGCTGGEQRTLTFSVLVGPQGEIEEYMVRAGVVRNFVVASYAEVDAVLGFVEEKWEKPFVSGESSSTPPPNLTHLEPHVANLRALYTASQAFVARRFRDGVFTQSRPVAKLTGVVWPHTTDVVGFPMNTEDGQAYTYTGYPFFSSLPSPPSSPLPYLSQYQTSAQHSLDTHSRSLVAECMKLASRACSMFCRDHSVPILRRWAEAPVLDSEEGLRRVLQARTGDGYLLWESNTKSSSTGYHLLGTHLLSDSTAGYTLDLRGHWGLGVPPHEGYVRCTSPLRRYADLVVHWQVKSALIAVAALHTHSTSLSSNSSSTSTHTPKIPPSLLPFSAPRLRAFAIHNQAAERFRKRIAGQHEAWWGVAWLMRYLEVVQFLEEGQGRGRYRFTASAVVRNNNNNNGNDNGFGFGSPESRLESGSLNRHLPDPKRYLLEVLAANNNPFRTLTATLTAPPETNRDSKKMQAAVYLTALGIKAVLTEEERGARGGGGGDTPYNIAALRVGDTVPVEVNAMRLGVRPQVQVVPRRV
ncbi:MAG: hypothetical protein NXY57DRAFT_941609 [Lentinula lateritia]|nr:MAG: hypothetical protein NXY57DRAFT_941609 [Lentinula lateritia]